MSLLERIVLTWKLRRHLWFKSEFTMTKVPNIDEDITWLLYSTRQDDWRNHKIMYKMFDYTDKLKYTAILRWDTVHGVYIVEVSRSNLSRYKRDLRSDQRDLNSLKLK